MCVIEIDIVEALKEQIYTSPNAMSVEEIAKCITSPLN
jgi:hypothetical protein